MRASAARSSVLICYHKSMKREDGFTLPELLVTLAVSIVLVVVLLFVARPADFSAQELQAERRLHLASLMQALERYRAEEGRLPENIPTKTTGLSSDGYDICRQLVPKYIEDIPIDSRDGIKTVETFAETDERCDAEDVEYFSGYTIMQHKDGSITLSDETAADKHVSLTR